MKQSLLIVFILTFNLICDNVFSQENYFRTNNDLINFYKVNNRYEPAKNKLFLDIENANFIKNNEYFNNYYPGYTLIGYYLKPEITYSPGDRVNLRAGFHLLKYSGLDNFSQKTPIFSIELKLNKRTDLIIGTLKGNIQHNLPEPLYQFERLYTSNVENGIQLLYNSLRINSDIWLNWQKFINKGDPFQEELIFGNMTNINVFNFHNSFFINIPFYAVVSHKGGQIDSSDKSMQTLVNLASGISFRKKMDSRFLKSINLDGLYYTYNDISPNPYLNYENGQAFNMDIGIQTSHFKLSAGYWNSNKFFSPLGEPLFQSIISDDDTYYEARKQIFTAKLIYNKKIKEYLFAGLRFEQYYDLNNNNYDFSFGIYLIFKNQFLLKKLR
ncbi:hypothetical protein ACFLTI_00070 [Bacteroidota bacterium]